MKLIQASFFWKNNEPSGIGFSFNTHNGFSPEILGETFLGETWKNYARNTDNALGSGIVNDYFNQLAAISQARAENRVVPVEHALLVALNIYWLTSRGFLPNDEFNGYQFITKSDL